MNILEALKAELIKNGVLVAQADAIMEIAVASDNFDNIRDRWYEDADGYPPGFINILFGLLRPIAYAWICEHAPQAWFRPVFSPGIVGLEGQSLDDFIKSYQHDKQGFKKE